MSKSNSEGPIDYLEIDNDLVSEMAEDIARMEADNPTGATSTPSEAGELLAPLDSGEPSKQGQATGPEPSGSGESKSSDGPKGPQRSGAKYKIPKKEHPETMFRPFCINAARQSSYLNREVEFPPRAQKECSARQKLTDNIVYQICASHATNKIPKEAKHAFRQTFVDLEVSRDLQWLDETIGETRWLFMTGLYNHKHSKPSKLVLGSVSRRVVVMDLRTLSSSGGLPDPLRAKIELEGLIPVGEHIKQLLEDLNLSVQYCIDTLEVMATVVTEEQTLFKLPPRTVGGLILDHWVMGCLWYEEFLGYSTKEEFHAFEEFFPHPQVRYWPWSKDDACKHWGLLITGHQAAFARNNVLLDLVVLLTYTLQEMGSTRVVFGSAGSEFKDALAIPSSASWPKAAAMINAKFRKCGVYPGRVVDLKAPSRSAPSAEAIPMALSIDTQATASAECRAIDALLKFCDELKKKERVDNAKRYVPEPIKAGKQGHRSIKDRLGKREPSSGPSRGRSPQPKRSNGPRAPRHRSISQASSSRSVPEGAALAASLPFGEAEAPEGAQMVVWPRRFQSSPALGIHCPFCGQRKPKRHRTLDQCEEYQAYARRYGSDVDKWPLVSCTYVYCRSPKDHKVKICPWLHSFCQRCKVRGHASGEECNRDNLALQVAYNNAAPFGYLTSSFATDHHWQFVPKEVDLGEVVFLGKIHKVDWTSGQFEEYRVANDENRRRLLSHEYHR